jgi:hypothetical protein
MLMPEILPFFLMTLYCLSSNQPAMGYFQAVPFNKMNLNVQLSYSLQIQKIIGVKS